jgi:NADP-dependent 3-hydroxy acid dehydrogenase YdfG
VKHPKLAVITGATSGIGAAIARELAAAGTRVLLIGRNPRKLAAATRRIPPRYRAGSALVDLRSVAAIKGLLRELRRSSPRVDLLVHCAGEYHRSEGGRLDGETFDVMLEVNVRAPYLLTRGLAPLLARSGGQVIFLNSSVVRNPGAGVAGYKATRHALQGLADSLRQDLNRRGIRVSSIFPGRTATARMRRICALERKPYQPRLLLSARDLARLVVALARLPAQLEITDLHVRSVTPY